ncbi:MAG TPA: cytochrome c biogenesis protein CcdA [Candidatus Limnocylindria bacterium]|nr:cytochrome c biogenesis protein CcdA [Candidatus Limnocylindria bacterium]
MEVSIGLAFVAGLLSFASPCVLALVPVYLAFLGEAAVADGRAAPNVTSGGGAVAALRQPAFGQALLFVLGFSAVFVLLGVSVGLLGQAVFRVNAVRQAVGLAVIALGVVTTGALGPILDRVRIGLPPATAASIRGPRALVLGGLVALGWTPCIGPVLGAILTMGASAGSVGVAAVLLVAYSAGLAVPFLAAAVALPRLSPLLAAMRRHHAALRIASGLFIVLVGVLIYLNAFARLAGLFVFL